MIALGIDTSTNLAIFGLAIDSNLVSGLTINTHESQLKDTIPAIDYLLKKNSLKIKDVDLFIVGLGPGSWTGIRVGVTTMKSIAHALNKPIVGISTFNVLACNLRFSNYPVFSIIDATRGEIYCSKFDCSGNNPINLEDNRIISINDFLSEINEQSILIGSGVLKYEDMFRNSNKPILYDNSSINFPQASNLIEVGAIKYKNYGSDDVYEMVPLYLQKTSAESILESKKEQNESFRN